MLCCGLRVGASAETKANHSGFRRDQRIGIFKCHQFIVRTDQSAGITLSPEIMSQCGMILELIRIH